VNKRREKEAKKEAEDEGEQDQRKEIKGREILLLG